MKFLPALHRASFFTVLFLIGCLPVTRAQRNTIKLDTANCARFTTGFRNVIVLDQRPDTLGTIGYVKLGLGNRPVKVQTAGPLAEEIAAYYRALSGKAASNSGKDLVVVIYDLMATEDRSGFTREFAFFRYRAAYFIGKDVYTALGMVDTTVEVSAGDVTGKLIRKVDECLGGFCQELMDKLPSVVPDTLYTLADIRELEAAGRLKMPAYKATSYPDGIYPTWADFLQLNHLEGRKLLGYKNARFTAQALNKRGKPYRFGLVAVSTDKIVDPGRIIVFQGVPYKAFEGRFYPMSFSGGNHFHFTAKTSRYNPRSTGMAPMVGFGMGGVAFGAMIGTGGKYEEYDFTINWRTGKVVPGRQIVKSKRRRS